MKDYIMIIKLRFFKMPLIVNQKYENSADSGSNYGYDGGSFIRNVSINQKLDYNFCFSQLKKFSLIMLI